MSNTRKTEEKIRSHLYTLMSDLLVENDYGKVLNFFIRINKVQTNLSFNVIPESYGHNLIYHFHRDKS